MAPGWYLFSSMGRLHFHGLDEGSPRRTLARSGLSTRAGGMERKDGPAPSARTVAKARRFQVSGVSPGVFGGTMAAASARIAFSTMRGMFWSSHDRSIGRSSSATVSSRVLTVASAG